MMHRPERDEAQPLLSHFIELRSRLLKIVVVFIICLFALMPFKELIFSTIAQPMMEALPSNGHMQSIGVIAPAFVPIKATVALAFLITVPHTLYQIWAFIAPGLYSHEKKLAIPLIIASIMLFFIGMAFTYFVVFPLLFQVLSSMLPKNVTMATDIDHYLSFVIGMFIAFGVSFQVPIIVILLNKIGILSIERMQQARSYVIVGAFAVAAVVTPPDILSQFLLAIPLWILYEFGIVICRLMNTKKSEE